MPGRLMAGHMALDHVAKVRVLPGQPLWRYRLGVRTGGSQPSNRGSIPRSAIVFRASLILDIYNLKALNEVDADQKHLGYPRCFFVACFRLSSGLFPPSDDKEGLLRVRHFPLPT